MSILRSDLLQNYMCECCFMNFSVVDDAYGGYDKQWTEGAHFTAVVTEDTSQQAIVAGIEHATTFYGVKTEKGVPLSFDSVFKRLNDGKTFRIRSGDVLPSPVMSALDMQVLSAEEYDIV